MTEFQRRLKTLLDIAAESKQSAERYQADGMKILAAIHRERARDLLNVHDDLVHLYKEASLPSTE